LASPRRRVKGPPGPRGSRSPASTVLSGRYDSRPPFPPRFVAFAWRYRSDACLFASADGKRQASADLGLGHPVAPAAGEIAPTPRLIPESPVETTGPPTFLGNPIVLLPCSSTPAGPLTSGHCDAATRPPLTPRRRLPRAKILSRLNHMASALAVYASQRRLPERHARLASGCRPGSTGRA